MIRRTSPPKRTAPPRRSTKPIAKINVKAAAKRKGRYRKYLASAAWKRIRREAITLAGNRCEATVDVIMPSYLPQIVTVTDRCPKTARLTVHHKTYARFGGNEIVPDDVLVLCRDCHNRLEALKPRRSGLAYLQEKSA